MKLSELKRLSAGLPDLTGKALQQWLSEQVALLDMDPSAIYQELEMSSEHVDTHRDTSWSNAHMNLHSHSFYELLYCCNDCGAEYLVGSERYRLQSGDIIFVPPGVSHRPLLPEEMTVPYERYVIWISPKFMEGFRSLYHSPFSDANSRFAMVRTNGTKWEFLRERFAEGVRESEHRADGWEAAVIGNTMVLLANLKRAADDRSAPILQAETPQLLDMLMAHIEQNYTDSITLTDLAKGFYVSSSTISHLFKQKLGISFYRYVTQRRLIAAKTLIESGTPLEETAIRSGFGDYTSFYRAFKKEFGISPKQYRSHFCGKT
ncbi:MAG: helix-turn-helix domain-containing protein [Oscillospiraceae bacterium]|nr:helix-turn-helix domain-containing protein [Oscillospiraceae bacterium]